MKLSSSGGYDLCGILARWSWIPLQYGEAKLMMHEVTFRIVNVACPKLTTGRTAGRGFGERATSRTWVCAGGRVGSPLGRYLHSFCG